MCSRGRNGSGSEGRTANVEMGFIGALDSEPALTVGLLPQFTLQVAPPWDSAAWRHERAGLGRCGSRRGYRVDDVWVGTLLIGSLASSNSACSQSSISCPAVAPRCMKISCA